MTKGVSLTTLVVIIHNVFLLPPFAVSQKSTQDLVEMPRYQVAQSALNDQKLFRPTPQEREAINKLLDMKPRPKTFNEADVTYLKALLNKAAWLGIERRIMHKIWSEVTGKPWGASDGNNPKLPESMQ